MKKVHMATTAGQVVGVATAIALMTTGMTAHAQTSASKGIELEEIIVTAQRTVETASKTPIALTVISGDALKEQGVVSVVDLQKVAPAVNIDRSAFGVNINIRGVTTTDNTSKGAQGVSFNVDQVPIGRPAEIAVAFMDVERIEVLRGPQGTLYGKSSTGGAINVITNKPKDKFEASASVEIGNYNARRGELVVNAPVTDNFAVRAAVNYNLRDGFLDPSLGNYQTPVSAPSRNDQNNRAARLSGLWTISESSSLLLTGTYGHVGGVGPGGALYTSVLNKSGKAARQVYFNPFIGAIDQTFHNFTTELNVGAGPVRMTYIGAKRYFDTNNVTSGTYDPANNGNRYGWGQYRGTFETDYHELRFSNAMAQRIEFVAGANYFNEDLHESDHNWAAAVATPTMAASVNGIDPLNNTVHKSTGVFAQFNLHATDDLKFTLGARNSSDKVRRRGTFAAGPGPWLDTQGRPCVAPNDCVGTPNNGDQSANKMTYRVGVDYQLADNKMLYASVATGYKEGGFNDFDVINNSNSSAPYIPEQLTAFEAGFKGQLMPNLQFNSALYYYDYSKMQISSTVAVGTANVIYTRPVPAKLQGWENELHYKINPTNMLDVTVALTQSKYTNFMAGRAQNVSWIGQRIDKTPSVSGTLGYTHTWFVRDNATVEAHLGSKYSGSYFVSDFVNAVHYVQDSFTSTDFTLKYKTEAGFEIQGYVNNIEDDMQVQGAPNGQGTVNVSEPRTYGVRASLKF